MRKAGINDTEGLHEALGQFEAMLDRSVTSDDPSATRLRDLIFKARLQQGGDIQFTPEPLATRLVSLAGITAESKVLEPEAGIAGIADKVKEITPNVDCVEIDADFREILQLKGHNLVAGNIFEYEQNPIYDAVIMNPPFSKEIEHIKYAFGFVKPGGSLVAVCSMRFTFHKKQGYPGFCEWLYEHNLYSEKTDKRFESTGTVSMIIKIKKTDEKAA